MIKIKPIKYILNQVVIAILFFVISSLIMFAVFNCGAWLIKGKNLPWWFIIFFCFISLIVLVIHFYYSKNDNAIIIDKGLIIVNIDDGFNSYGWVEQISKIISVEFGFTKDIVKYFKSFNKQKGIILKFENGKIRYICVDQFNKNEINKIISAIKECSMN